MPEEGNIKDVLVLEDYSILREIVEDHLKEWGYTPHSVTYSGEFEKLLASMDSFYAAILDNAAPIEAEGKVERGEGRKFAYRIRQEHPEARVALFTLDNIPISEIKKLRVKGITYVDKSNPEELKEFLEKPMP